MRVISDGTYGIIMFLSILASAAVLVLRFRIGRAQRRLLKELQEKLDAQKKNEE